MGDGREHLHEERLTDTASAPVGSTRADGRMRFLHDHLLLVHCDVASKNTLIRVTLAAAVPDIVAVLGDLGSVMEVCVHPRPLVISQGGGPQQSGQTHIHWVGPLLVRAWAVGWVGS